MLIMFCDYLLHFNTRRADLRALPTPLAFIARVNHGCHRLHCGKAGGRLKGVFVAYISRTHDSKAAFIECFLSKGLYQLILYRLSVFYIRNNCFSCVKITKSDIPSINALSCKRFGNLKQGLNIDYKDTLLNRYILHIQLHSQHLPDQNLLLSHRIQRRNLAKHNI